MSKKEVLSNSTTSSATNTDAADGARTRTWSSSTQHTITATGNDAPTFKALAPTTLQEHRRSSYVGRDSAPPTATAANLSRCEAEQKLATIRQHYYPEGEWGWVIVVCCFTVNAITYGLQLNYASAMHKYIVQRHGRDKYFAAFYPGALSLAMSTFMSPIIVATCRKKSPRVTAILGGLISTLGCLFMSFTTQFHQIFVSWCFVVGIGLGIVREAANIMVGSYFKRRRESVELICLMGTGIGVALFNHFLQYVLSKLGWRFGLQATTGLLSSLFIIGMLYRPASLYHPQRRAIVHLKNQRRKIKEKNPTTQKAPFFEFSTLRTKTVKVLMAVCFMASFAIHTPFLFIVPLADCENGGSEVVDSYLLQTIIGLAHAFGSCLFGILVVGNSGDCFVGRRYLSQAGLLGLSLSCVSPLALEGFRGLSLLAVLCGALSGGLCYSLKLLVFERLRARHFSRAWGFVHWAMSAPIFLIVPITQFIGGSSAARPAGPGIVLPSVALWDIRAAFYVSSGCALLACLLLFALPVSHRAACRIIYADPFQRNGSLSSSWHTCSLSGSSFRNISGASKQNASQSVKGGAFGGIGGVAGSLGERGTCGGSTAAIAAGTSISGSGAMRFRECPLTMTGALLSSGPVASSSGINGPTEVRAEECVSCRQCLDQLQRTVSWATSVDLLNAQICDFEDNDDFNEIGTRPELLTFISEEGLVEMVDPTLFLSDCCECKPYDEDLSPSPVSPMKDKHPTGSFGHLHQWQPAMTPIEEVTSTV